jgi:hypothetical protein
LGQYLLSLGQPQDDLAAVVDQPGGDVQQAVAQGAQAEEAEE